MEEKNVLREAMNNFTIEGTLEEKDLQVKEIEGKNGQEDYEAITGKLVIRTDEYSTHEVQIFAKRLTKEGSESKLFKGYETIMKEYLSNAEIKAKSLEEVPTKLNVKGNFGINDYYSEVKDKMMEKPQLNGKFITRVNDENFDPKATFDIEFYIGNMKPETKGDEETGRIEVKGIIPVYNGGVIPMTFVVTDEDGVAEYFDNTFSKGESVNMWGQIINSQIVEKKEKKGFGKSKDDSVTKYKHEFLIDGGEEDALDDEKAFDSSLIKKALAERQVMLDNKMEEAKQKKDNSGKATNKKSKGFGKGSKRPASVEIDDNDIPF